MQSMVLKTAVQIEQNIISSRTRQPWGRGCAELGSCEYYTQAIIPDNGRVFDSM